MLQSISKACIEIYDKPCLQHQLLRGFYSTLASIYFVGIGKSTSELERHHQQSLLAHVYILEVSGADFTFGARHGAAGRVSRVQTGAISRQERYRERGVGIRERRLSGRRSGELGDWSRRN